MNIFLIAPPRLYWPYINEQDNFLVQQWMVCLGAVIRNAGYKVTLIDCMAQKIGWKTLESLIKLQKPDVVAVGENHALYANEAVKCLELAKKTNPSLTTIAGGAHFSNLSSEYITNERIDFIVIGEGEITIIELLKYLKEKKEDLHNVKGISFSKDGNITQTTPRPLIEDLSLLPMPAYDLLPMNLYGKAKLLYTPGGTTIFHSRGCTSSCSFCSWWTTMAKRKEVDGKITLRPMWRSKGYLKTVNEMEFLQKKYNKNFFLFVDPSWNISQQFNIDFSTELLKRQLKINYFAFIRSDALLRDEKEGVFEEIVKSGLCHLCIGAERSSDTELSQFGKKFYAKSSTLETFEILNKKYPNIFKQATFLVGVRDETYSSLDEQLKLAKELKADHPAFHPLTPVPGTELFKEAIKKNWLVTKDFKKFDWATPILKTKYLSSYEIQLHIYKMHKKLMTPGWFLKGILSSSRYKRNMYLWWLLVTSKIFFSSIFKKINPFKAKTYTNLIKPKWYDK